MSSKFVINFEIKLRITYAAVQILFHKSSSKTLYTKSEARAVGGHRRVWTSVNCAEKLDMS